MSPSSRGKAENGLITCSSLIQLVCGCFALPLHHLHLLPMQNLSTRYADLSDSALAAASRSISLEERIAHLEQAQRYARLAVAEHHAGDKVVELFQGDTDLMPAHSRFGTC